MEKSVEEKIQRQIDIECQYADKNGRAKLSTCSVRNWDKDIYNYHNTIIEAIRNRGYNVSVSVNYGVIDIVTTPKINVK